MKKTIGIINIIIFLLAWVNLLNIIILDNKQIIFLEDTSSLREIVYIILIIIYVISLVVYFTINKDQSYKFKYLSIIIISLLTAILIGITFNYTSPIVNGNRTLETFYYLSISIATFNLIIAISLLILPLLNNKINFLCLFSYNIYLTIYITNFS